MDRNLDRRAFLGAVGAVAAGAAAGAGAAPVGGAADKKLKVVGICCSPRKGKTTAMSLGVCLAAARDADARIETELIELAGMDIPVFDPTAEGGGDFARLVPKLSDPEVAGVVIGTPVYFGNMTSLCKAFLDHCMVFRKKGFALANKAAGVLAVGGARNGGQEMTIQSVQAALLCQEMVIVGDGRPTGHFGATVWSGEKDQVTEDTFGMATARNLGRRVAEVALRLA